MRTIILLRRGAPRKTPSCATSTASPWAVRSGFPSCSTAGTSSSLWRTMRPCATGKGSASPTWRLKRCATAISRESRTRCTILRPGCARRTARSSRNASPTIGFRRRVSAPNRCTCSSSIPCPRAGRGTVAQLRVDARPAARHRSVHDSRGFQSKFLVYLVRPL